jgi:hypothetical protein
MADYFHVSIDYLLGRAVAGGSNNTLPPERTQLIILDARPIRDLSDSEYKAWLDYLSELIRVVGKLKTEADHARVLQFAQALVATVPAKDGMVDKDK